MYSAGPVGLAGATGHISAILAPGVFGVVGWPGGEGSLRLRLTGNIDAKAAGRFWGFILNESEMPCGHNSGFCFWRR
jgi:hypothetical protein